MSRALQEGRGTKPPGAQDEADASRWVRTMFGRIAHRYDLLNHVLSFNMDRYWRWRTVRSVRAVLRRPDARVLDLCCGTGDLLMALEKERGAAVWGSDFCHPMLVSAGRKLAAQGCKSALLEADTLRLPFGGGTIDLITVAFGLRNLANYEDGLREMLRVLRPGGTLAVLEFSKPPNRMFASLYDFYSKRFLPALGGAISGAGDAYKYLPDSVRRFPGVEELAATMIRAGFSDVGFARMTGGIVALHIGRARG